MNLAPLDTNWKATQGGTAGASSGAGGTTSNAVTITFPAPTANWGTVTHFSLFDAASGGNLLIWDALLAPRAINIGDAPPSFPVDTLQITVS